MSSVEEPAPLPRTGSAEKRKREEEPSTEAATTAATNEELADHCYRFEVEIAAPPSKVFDVVSDLSLAPKIDP